MYLPNINKKGNISLLGSKSLLLIILFAILILGIGYAQVSNVSLHINGTATAEMEEDILITNIVFDSSNNANQNDCIIREPYLTLMNSTITLGDTLSSTITYKVTIKNNTSLPAIYDDEVYSPGAGYDNTDIEFVVSGIQNGDVLDPQEDVEITITFKYIDSLTTINNRVLNSYINFKFYDSAYVARIGNTYYETIQEAIADVPKDNTETTILLLKDATEAVEVAALQNIVFDLGEKVWHNDENTNVIINHGSIKLINGEINSNSVGNGAINNESGAMIDIDGARIVVTGGKQALYNNGGTAIIRNGSYLSNTSSDRSAVQNLAGGTLTITGATIIASRQNGVTNAGTLTIGIKDGAPDNEAISIRGNTYGINSTTDFNFYDGVLKGKTAAVNNVNKIVDKEDDYVFFNSTENINGTVYKTLFLAIIDTVTFDPNGGVVNETTRDVPNGYQVGTLPLPTYSGHYFDGWYTEANGGTKIDDSTIVNGDIIFYAHWTQVMVAQINGVPYNTLQEAINNVPNNTETTITIVRDITENVNIISSKKVELDIGSYTISNFGNNAVITNYGTVKIKNGNITTNADTALINNYNGGRVIITGGNLTSTGTRQVIYNRAGGIVDISGSAYLSSTTTGTPSGNESSLARATVQNLRNGTMNITGGTIIGVAQQAISNEGTLNIGSNDGTIDTLSPNIRGETYGIVSVGTLNYYDGITMGITGAIDGTVTGIETNSHFIDGTELIDSKTYLSKYLESD